MVVVSRCLVTDVLMIGRHYQSINDTDYRLRDALEKWAETIQYHNFALGHNQLGRWYQQASRLRSGQMDTWVQDFVQSARQTR